MLRIPEIGVGHLKYLRVRGALGLSEPKVGPESPLGHTSFQKPVWAAGAKRLGPG